MSEKCNDIKTLTLALYTNTNTVNRTILQYPSNYTEKFGIGMKEILE